MTQYTKLSVTGLPGMALRSVSARTIHTKIICNISKQVIEAMYQIGDADNAAGDVPYYKTGMLRLIPGSSVQIEEARIDLGQLQNLEGKNLIKIYNGLV